MGFQDNGGEDDDIGDSSGEPKGLDEREAPGGVPQEGLNEQAEVVPVGKYKCKYCPKTFDTGLDLGRHVVKEHREESRLAKIQKERRYDADVTTVGQEKRPMPLDDNEIMARIRIEGPVALERVLRERLEDLLTGDPQIRPLSKDKVLREWEIDPRCHLDMQALYRILTAGAGISPEKAFWVVDRLSGILQRFGPALQSPGAPPFWQPLTTNMTQSYGWGDYGRWGSPPPPPGFQQQLQSPPGYPAYQQGYPYPSQSLQPPQYYPTSPPITEDRVTKIVEDKQRELEDRIRSLIKEELQGVRSPQQEEMAEIDWPMGRAPDGTIINQKLRVPVNIVPYLLSKQPQQQGQDAKTIEDILNEFDEKYVQPIRDELKRTNIQLEEARKEADKIRETELRERLEELKARQKEAEERALERERELREQLKNRPVEGWQTDSYRLLGASIDKSVDLLKERKPLDTIIRAISQPQPVPSKNTQVYDQMQQAGIVVEK